MKMMARFLFILIWGCFIGKLHAQVDSSVKLKKSFFERRFIIGQSLASITNDAVINPAQFQATFPKHDTASYSLNLGISFKLTDKLNNFQHKITAEYHRNSLTDSLQNNFQVGYSFSAKLPGLSPHYFSGDLKWVYDGVAISHSIAADGSYTLLFDQSTFNINAPTFLNTSKTKSLFFAPYIGFQAQDVFAASSDSAKGFIFRPLFSSSMQFFFNNKVETIKQSQPAPVVGLSISYTGRWDLGNSTKKHEGYTYLGFIGTNADA